LIVSFWKLTRFKKNFKIEIINDSLLQIWLALS
jgi:hypothetical protein